MITAALIVVAGVVLGLGALCGEARERRRR
jgi:hypothetical protein